MRPLLSLVARRGRQSLMVQSRLPSVALTHRRTYSTERWTLAMPNPALLLNNIAKRYESLARVLMEYIDNSFDNFERWYENSVFRLRLCLPALSLLYRRHPPAVHHAATTPRRTRTRRRGSPTARAVALWCRTTVASGRYPSTTMALEWTVRR